MSLKEELGRFYTLVITTSAAAQENRISQIHSKVLFSFVAHARMTVRAMSVLTCERDRLLGTNLISIRPIGNLAKRSGRSLDVEGVQLLQVGLGLYRFSKNRGNSLGLQEHFGSFL